MDFRSLGALLSLDHDELLAIRRDVVVRSQRPTRVKGALEQQCGITCLEFPIRGNRDTVIISIAMMDWLDDSAS